MANIHRIGDYQNNAGGGRAPLLGGRQPNAVPFMTTMRQEGDPRKEGPIDMLRLTCCPSLRLVSFISIITVIDIAIFITTLIYSHFVSPGWQKAVAAPFLSPSNEALDDFGSRLPQKIYSNLQLWRFLTPVFLHANFLHIFFNMMSQLILGAQIELILGPVKIAMVYFICAVGGNVFGALCSTAGAVGASTAIVGFLGVFIAFIVVNWKRINDQVRCFMICIIIFIILFSVLFSLGGSSSGAGVASSEVDQWGHLGGLITGVTAGMFIMPPMGGPPGHYENSVKKVGYGLTAFYFVLGFTLFFAVVKP